MTELQLPELSREPLHGKRKTPPRWVGYLLTGVCGLAVGAVLLWAISSLAGIQWKPKKVVVVQLESAFTQLPVTDLDDGTVTLIEDSDLGTLQLQNVGSLGRNPLTDALLPEEGEQFAPTVEGYRVLQGIDVSEWQGTIDWRAVAEDGIDFAILRCGWRGAGEDGALHVDSSFYENYHGAKAAGLAVGVYFYSQALGQVEGTEEAKFVLEILDGMELDLPVFFDWEWYGEESHSENLPSSNLNNAAKHFLQTIENSGYQAGLYAYKYLAYMEYDLPSYASYPFWLAEYGSLDFYYGYTFLQYTDIGEVDGIYGNVDRNLMIVKETEE